MVQTQTGPVTSAAERYMIIYMMAVMLIITILVIIIFVVYQRRKNKLLEEKRLQQRRFNEELLKTQSEIQEQTLKHIAWELHDNVGQLLAFANMQLNLLSSQVADNLKEKVTDASKIVKDGLNEVRLLSKTLNNEVVLDQGLIRTIENELGRLKKLKFNTADLKIIGEPRALRDPNHEIIVFRIVQEFLSNSVKYSEAKNLFITVDYQPDHIIITAKDDGKGFDMNTVEKGSGLITIKSRADLIGAKTHLSSVIGSGTTLEIVY